MTKLTLLSLAAAVAAFTTASHARPPDNSVLIYTLWFESLYQPTTRLPCCTISDCR